nr:hypothetical protein [Clostridium paraputrificum]
MILGVIGGFVLVILNDNEVIRKKIRDYWDSSYYDNVWFNDGLSS